MTLALYGKSKQRQVGLIGLALLAALIGIIAAFLVATNAFAHHLDEKETLPTCDNGGTYLFEAYTGGWSGYREAVVSVSQGSVPPFQSPSQWDGGTGPFVYHGNTKTIISISGTGSVDSAGTVKQYGGSFGNGVDLDENVNTTDDTESISTA